MRSRLVARRPTTARRAISVVARVYMCVLYGVYGVCARLRVGSQGSYRPSTLTVRLHVSSQRCRAKRWVRVSPRAHTDTSVCGQVLSRSQVCLLGTLCARDTLIACSSSHAPAECVGGSQRERRSVRVILRRIDRDAWMTKGGGNQRPWAGT